VVHSTELGCLDGKLVVDCGIGPFLGAGLQNVFGCPFKFGDDDCGRCGRLQAVRRAEEISHVETSTLFLQPTQFPHNSRT
jgi:hypothetical protein